MKTLSIQQKLMVFIAIILSVTFCIILYSSIIMEDYLNIWKVALLFYILVFFSAFILGYNDQENSSSGKLGFKYHLIVYIVVNAINIPSILILLGVSLENLLIGFIQVVAWGVGVLFHWLFVNYTLKLVKNS